MNKITLEDAIAHDCMFIVDNLVSNRYVNPNEPVIYEGYKTTPLGLCIRERKRDIARFLLEKDVDSIKPLPDGRTPLQAAIYERDVKMVRLLLDHDAKCQMEEALIYAVERDEPKVCREFIDRGVTIDSSRNRPDFPIICATRSKSLRALEVLLEAKADVNVVGKDGYAAIQVWEPDRSYIGFHILYELIEYRADINATDSAGDTPLLKAIKALNEDCVDYLLRKKADLNIKNALGQTALSLALERDDLDLAEVLIRSGADTSSVSEQMEARARTDDKFEEFLISQIGQSGMILPKWVQGVKESNESWEVLELNCEEPLAPKGLCIVM